MVRVLNDVRTGVRAAAGDVGSIGFDDKTTARVQAVLEDRCAELTR
jgi:hypothetical protein